MTQIMFDVDVTKFTVPISMNRSTFNVYDAEAKRRGMEHAGMLIEALQRRIVERGGKVAKDKTQ